MNTIKLTTVSVITFLIVITILQPQMLNPGIGFQAGGANTPGNSESLQQLTADYTNILQLNIPRPSDPDHEWHAYVRQLKLMARPDDSPPLFSFSNEATPFLAYLAKHRPNFFLDEIELGNIDISVFGTLLQMGLLQDWSLHTDNQSALIRSQPKALLSLAAKYGDGHAQQQARLAFLDSSVNQRLFPASPRSLAYALNVIDPRERSFVLDGVSQLEIKQALTSLPVLAKYLDQSEYIGFIKTHAGKRYRDRDHLVDLMLADDVDAGLEVVSDYRKSIGKGTHEYSSYCVVCALALGLEGGVGPDLLDALQDEAPDVQP